ncbi:MAG: 30S ribosomal protein S7 [Thiotrichales bacterium]|nr:MAG: 30S ribosomal protein S7 [Thiotrichales bacterium]
MSRRRRAEVRDILPDAKYGDEGLAKFINYLMHDGKKSGAVSIVYGAMENAFDKVKGVLDVRNPLEAFYKAVDNVKPKLEVKSRRVGGATYQVPVELDSLRSRSRAMKWIIDAARSVSGKSMLIKLADEFVNACHGRGSAVKKKDDTHKMAEANRAFAHFKW